MFFLEKIVAIRLISVKIKIFSTFLHQSEHTSSCHMSVKYWWILMVFLKIVKIVIGTKPDRSPHVLNNIWQYIWMNVARWWKTKNKEQHIYFQINLKVRKCRNFENIFSWWIVLFLNPLSPNMKLIHPEMVSQSTGPRPDYNAQPVVYFPSLGQFCFCLISGSVSKPYWSDCDPFLPHIWFRSSLEIFRAEILFGIWFAIKLQYELWRNILLFSLPGLWFGAVRPFLKKKTLWSNHTGGIYL